MTIEEIRQRHSARPFSPFTINLADGRKYAVKSPEFLAQSQGGRTIYLATKEGLEVIDLLMVVSLTVGADRNGQHRKSA